MSTTDYLDRPRVLGIDPAMRGPCGLALIADVAGAPRLVGFGLRRAPTRGTPAARIRALAEQIAGVVDRANDGSTPLVLAYEASWHGTNAQTMRLLALVGGAVIGIAAARKLAVYEVQPVEGKLALAGDRLASKEMQVAAARQQFGVALSEHEADAVGIALHARGVHLKQCAIARSRG